MRRFIMTGAPGSGKTSILRALENLGYAVSYEDSLAFERVHETEYLCLVASIRRESDSGPITILTRGGR
jgi:dephospho-CoA kinase